LNAKESGEMKTAADILTEKGTPMLVTVPADSSIEEAVRRMVEKNIGAILVTRNDVIAGIWTERDFLRESLSTGFDPKTARIGEFMQQDLKSAQADTPLIQLQEMFLGLFIRHILIKKEDRYLGLLSIGDVLRASLLEKDQEIRELNQIASWEYYENWGWHRKYKAGK
jgi:signal-transduction protein with cAMP-binding, CBS, and nucleotidyltransferase domain